MAEEKKTEETKKYTHVGVLLETQRKVALLARALSNGENTVNMYDLVKAWADDAWEDAKQAGLVTDAMLEMKAHVIGRGKRDISEIGKKKTRKTL